MCCISTGEVHQFKWDSPSCESCRPSEKCKLKIINAFCGQSFLSVSPWGEVKPGFRTQKKSVLSPEWRCPFNRGNKYKGYVNTFPGPNFVSTEKRCPKGEVPLFVGFFFIVSERLLKGFKRYNLSWTHSYIHSSWRGLQLSPSKTGTFGTNTVCPSLESQLKGIMRLIIHCDVFFLLLCPSLKS